MVVLAAAATGRGRAQLLRSRDIVHLQLQLFFVSEESSAPFLLPFSYRSLAKMAETLLESLKSLSISAQNLVSHVASSSPDTWKNALAALTSDPSALPSSFEYTKTLVFKPKTAKTAKPVPVVVVARAETETSTSALGKQLNLKELRLATPELLQEFLGATKDDGEWRLS